MAEESLLDQLKESVQYIRNMSKMRPRVGITLGSGLSGFVKGVNVETIIPYKDIPHFSPSAVDGHPGNMILGRVGETPLVVLQGRVHYYEGHSMERVVYPTRVIAQLGIEKLILTNAAGGLDPNMKPGDLMLISDHINLMGTNPLIGPNISALGLRFPDMTAAYDRELIEIAATILRRRKICHSVGVYCGVTGPTYETAAEVRYLHMIGGHAVGMSTVPENIAAKHMGLRVLGVSCISNLATGLSNNSITHDEVKETAARVEKDFTDFLVELISGL
ncbi:MAG: purine-nucleoside phosphorylase [Bdellovibrionales bacterium RBG_16_40_8]|nr:MAG: purine-nucleoside phosphorylase [Bdellovibrionales bacterium RBG_16_40_8]